MAHNLNFNKERNTYSFVINAGKDKKDIAWHGLGQVYDKPLTVTEALEGANADYNVVKKPLLKLDTTDVDMNGFIRYDYNNVVSTHECTVREDTGEILGVVGKGYTVVQNKIGFDFVDVLCNGEFESNKAFIETAGVLGNGERTFVTAKMPDNLYIGNNKNDEISNYILFVNSHDGSSGVTALFTPVRVVCNNTLNMALSNCKNKITFKHTKSVTDTLNFTKQENIRMVRTLMDVHTKYTNELSRKLAELGRQEINETDKIALVGNTILSHEEMRLLAANNYNIDTIDEISTRKKNIMNGILYSIDQGIGQESWRGTKLWVLNGVTSYFQNTKEWKGTTKKHYEKKFDSILNGGSNMIVQKTFDLLSA